MPGELVGGARGDEQVLVRRVGEVVEGAPAADSWPANQAVSTLTQTSPESIGASRSRAVAVERVGVRTGRQPRVVRREHVLVKGPDGEGVVDPERRVAGRRVLGEHELVGELAGVAVARTTRW